VNNLTDKPMPSLKKYIPVLIIVLPVIIAVLIRGTDTGHFKYDAERWAEPSLKATNIITPGKLSELKGDVMVINLSENPDNPTVHPYQVAVSPDSVLSSAMLKKIGRNKGAVVLWSDDPAVSARIWMLISQTGKKDLYILQQDTLNESLKEKFRADTLISPEL